MNHNFVPSPKMCYFCKVILKPALKACPTTNIAKGGRQSYSSDPIVYEGNVLPLARICKMKQALHIGF